MSDWKPFTPIYTDHRAWYRRLMFWLPKPRMIEASYEQIGKTVHIKIGDTLVLKEPIRYTIARGDSGVITVSGEYRAS